MISSVLSYEMRYLTKMSYIFLSYDKKNANNHIWILNSYMKPMVVVCISPGGGVHGGICWPPNYKDYEDINDKTNDACSDCKYCGKGFGSRAKLMPPKDPIATVT